LGSAKVFEREKFKEGNEMKSRWIATHGRERRR